MPVESPVRGDSHAGFGGRLGETERAKGRHRAPGRPLPRQPGARRGPPRLLERAAFPRRPGRREALQGRALVPAQGARQAHRPADRHARPPKGRRRRGMARLHAQGSRPRDLPARPVPRRRHDPHRSPPQPPRPQPPQALHPARQNDPQTPRPDPRRDPPRDQPRPHRSAQQQGPADHPPRVRVSLRRSRARTHHAHLRAGHPSPTTRTTRTRERMTLTTSMPREPELGCAESSLAKTLRRYRWSSRVGATAMGSGRCSSSLGRTWH